MNKYFMLYITIGAIVMVADTFLSYDKKFFPLKKAITLGLIDGIIWPFRIGWDLTAMIVNKIRG